MEDYKTRLRMLPVCSCGYIFDEGVTIHEHINDKNGIKYATYSIEPGMCPKCKKTIEYIEEYKYRVKDYQE